MPVKKEKKITKKPIKKPVKKTIKQKQSQRQSVSQKQNVVVNVHTGKSSSKKSVAKPIGKNSLSALSPPTIIYQNAPSTPFYPTTAPTVFNIPEPETIPIPIVNKVGQIANKIPTYKPISVSTKPIQQPTFGFSDELLIPTKPLPLLDLSTPANTTISLPPAMTIMPTRPEVVKTNTFIQQPIDYIPIPIASSQLPEKIHITFENEPTNTPIVATKKPRKSKKNLNPPIENIPVVISNVGVESESGIANIFAPAQEPAMVKPLTGGAFSAIFPPAEKPASPSGSFKLKPPPPLPKERTRKTPAGSREDLRERFYKQTSTEWADVKKSRKTKEDTAFLRQAVADLESGRKTKKDVLQEINDRKAGVAR